MQRYYLTLVAVCSFWGTIPLLARHVDLPPAAIVFVRVWVAAAGLALFLAVTLVRSAKEPLRSLRLLGGAPDGGRAGVQLLRDRPVRSVAAGLLLAVHWTAMFAGYQEAPDDTVVFVIFLAPVGVAALAPRLLGERLDARTLVALLVAVAGFALVAGPSVQAADAVGVAWAALAAVTFVALVLVSKPLAEVYGGLRLTLVEMVCAGVALIPLALTTDWAGERSVADAGWGWLVVLGLVHTAVGITLYLSALARVPATHAGILGYLEPVSVVVLSWALLSESPRVTTVAGGLLIIAAGALVVARTGVPAHVPG